MKVQIFIDGGNFHHLALRPLGIKEIDFSFDAFAHFLADGRAISDMGKRYYVGTVREREGDERSKQAMAKQVRLFNELKKTSWQIKTSKLREREEHIVIDARVSDHRKLLQCGIAGLDDKYDAAIVVSSDTDLVPMIDWVRFRLKKRIEYIGFSIPDKTGSGNDIRPTQSLIGRSDVQRVLVESDVRRFQK